MGKLSKFVLHSYPLTQITIDNCGYFNIGNIIKCETFPSKCQSKNTGERSKTNNVELHDNAGPTNLIQMKLHH